MPKRPSKKSIRVEFDKPAEHRKVVTDLAQRGFKASPLVRFFLNLLAGGESSAAEYIAAEYEKSLEDEAADDE